MDIGSILLGVALVLIVGAFVLNPLLSRRSREAERLSSGQQADLASQQEAIVTKIRELDFDYSLGKLPEEEYKAERAHWTALGVTILKQMDAARPAEEAALEAAIRERRGRKRLAIPAAHTPARTRREGSGASYCRTCGRKLEADDAFCPKCGTRVAAPIR